MRSQNKVTLRTLKLDHIPKYLGDQGYTTADLPSGRTINTMNVRRWRNSARSFVSDDTLRVKNVFPSANLTDDWDLAGRSPPPRRG